MTHLGCDAQTLCTLSVQRAGQPRSSPAVRRSGRRRVQIETNVGPIGVSSPAFSRSSKCAVAWPAAGTRPGSRPARGSGQAGEIRCHAARDPSVTIRRATRSAAVVTPQSRSDHPACRVADDIARSRAGPRIGRRGLPARAPRPADRGPRCRHRAGSRRSRVRPAPRRSIGERLEERQSSRRSRVRAIPA